ncbi:MAG: DNA polymerase III subunit delta' [Pegethrix bostrychoides GSE-TBD4-15B]|jgi:DNA polymerase-3 subunit delta'|uniref:DNA polymerase III subunit delta n=1 Tax=Pegethrix bostrychoides GSE-TBD4-15B TaxID=2839662 RepID=A0A951PAA3_9CYAN|nr:DNA polymerase III subunit delta' [Pegethrix bostrychoides GSE-TBD4-15B]
MSLTFPSPFAPLIGQDQAVELLSRAVGLDRIAPAYLFAGADGTGRRLAARCFAELLLAHKLNAGLRQRIQQGNHPDLLWVEPTYSHSGRLVNAAEAAELGIKRRAQPEIRLAQIREISRFLSRPPLEALRSLVVIEQAESMAEAAANGLLKTLEEPGRATLILLAPSPESLLPTLVSRCQRIPFRRLDPAALAQVLVQAGQAEILQHPEILALAQGSPGAAISQWQFSQSVPPELLQQLAALPSSARGLLELARQVDQSLEPEAQLWLLDYLQQIYWQQGKSNRLLPIEAARRYLKQYVQSRLVWEVTLLELGAAVSM